MQSKLSLIIFEYNQYIPQIGQVCGATGVEIQGSPFPGSRETYKKVNFSKSLIVTDELQQNLRWF